MSAGGRKVIVAAFIGNSLIAVTKFGAAAMTGSSAMASEAIHSVVDTGNQLLLLYGLKRAAKPPDEEFPFGHGKEIYFWSFVVAIIIFGLGGGISIWQGLDRIQHPHAIQNVIVNYVVLSMAIVFESGSWYVAWREFSKARGSRGVLRAVQRGKDPSLFVVLFEDTAAMLGLLAALAGVFLAQVTGDHLYDGMASIVIGLILGFTAAFLAYETKGLLIGEAADEAVVRGIRELANNLVGVNSVSDVLTMHLGPEEILVNVSIDFQDNLSAGQVEEVVAELDKAIRIGFPTVTRIFIEARDLPNPAGKNVPTP